VPDASPVGNVVPGVIGDHATPARSASVLRHRRPRTTGLAPLEVRFVAQCSHAALIDGVTFAAALEAAPKRLRAR
jgi:hypothetical protein